MEWLGNTNIFFKDRAVCLNDKFNKHFACNTLLARIGRIPVSVE